MLPCIAALILQTSQAPHATGFRVTAAITAALVRHENGTWAVKLLGPANPANWAADPDVLQLSLVAAGDEPGGHPTLSFVDASAGVQGVAVKDRAVSEASVAVHLSTGSSRQPGFVRLRANGFVLATDPTTTKMISLPVRASESLIYVSAPVERPTLEPGLRFFYLPKKQVPLKLDDGTILPFDKGQLRELRLESIDQKADGTFRATFRMEGWEGPLTLDGSGDPLAMPSLPPIIWDDTIRKLRSKYMNKPLWVYGGSIGAVGPYPEDSATVRLGVVEPIKLRKILRLYVPQVMLNVGPQIAALGGETRSSFYADNPIYTVADIGKRGEVTAAMGSSADDMSRMLKREVKLTGFQVVADEWHFERTFSSMSGISQHPDWTLDMAKNIADGKVQKGMTHAMVAWTLGWPCEPSSKRTMMKWSSWRYDIVNPYSYWVEFVNGKVSKFGEDGGKPVRKR